MREEATKAPPGQGHGQYRDTCWLGFSFPFAPSGFQQNCVRTSSWTGYLEELGEEHCEKVPEPWAGQPQGSRLEATEELVDKQLLH